MFFHWRRWFYDLNRGRRPLCRTIRCQTACKPGSVPRAWARGDGHSSGTPVAGRLARPTRAAARKPACRTSIAWGPACRPYLVLLPVGFTLPPPLPGARCALTAPFHPYPPSPRRAPVRAVCFLWHFPWGRPRRALPGTVFPWSPDFPPPTPGLDPGPAAAIRPSGPVTPRYGAKRRQATRAGRSGRPLFQGRSCR